MPPLRQTTAFDLLEFPAAHKVGRRLVKGLIPGENRGKVLYLKGYYSP
jgi:hypothetical protein